MTRCFTERDAKAMTFGILAIDYDSALSDDVLIDSPQEHVPTDHRSGSWTYDGKIKVTYEWEECQANEYRAVHTGALFATPDPLKLAEQLFPRALEVCLPAIYLSLVSHLNHSISSYPSLSCWQIYLKFWSTVH